MTSSLLTSKFLDAHHTLSRLKRCCYFSSLPLVRNAKVDKKEEVLKKIIYSSKLYEDRRWNKILEMRKLVRERNTKIRTPQIHTSIGLQYLDGSKFDFSGDVKKESDVSDGETSSSVMPIGLKVVSTEKLALHECSTEDDYVTNDTQERASSTVSLKKNWSNDYSRITDVPKENEDDGEWMLKYGTSNSKIPSSQVPCGGCGAHLHCKDESIPGFIPYELFVECKPQDLRTITCQRCYFLQNYNTALSMAVDARVYPKILQHIKRKKSLVLLAVDLTDFPCSIWPGVIDLVGVNCPVFVVGNKVDLLCGSKRGWITHVEESLRSCFPAKSNIVGVHLISAKTGFGVEELITKLHNVWQYQGDVYLVGCTNVGKSTLFNALLQSDYCKVKASDLLQRATTAPWPGTTLNLLKFPIMRPEGWRTYLRSQRLKSLQRENQLAQQQRYGKNSKGSPQLIGHIGRTFHQSLKDEEDPFSAPDFTTWNTPGAGLNPKDPDFVKGRWFYDTPGVLHDDQILDLLTTEELVKLLPRKTIEPRTVVMKPGWTLFIGGLARVDFLESEYKSSRWTVFVSRDLPITICFTEDATEVYDTLLGSDELVVPHGDANRIAKWPQLKSKDVYKFSGIGKFECCGDVVLSSCGWVSFTADHKEIISVRPWTPEGRGIYTRFPSLLPHAVNDKGVLMRGTPAFSRPRKQTPETKKSRTKYI